jgi:hypothetical protein
MNSKKSNSGWRNSIDWLASSTDTSVGCGRAGGGCSDYWTCTSSTNSFCCSYKFFIR